MKLLIKLLIPIALGVVAFMLNMAAGLSSQSTVSFVKVSKDVDIKEGDLFTDSNVEEVKVLDKLSGTLKGTAIPWSERAVLFGRSCPRPLKAGDIILLSDTTPLKPELRLEPGEEAVHLSLEGFITTSLPGILKVGDKITFWVYFRPTTEGAIEVKSPSKDPAAKLEEIGPFTILSLGKRITRESTDLLAASDMRDITFAVKKGATLDPKIKKLMEARLNRGGAAAGTEVVVVFTPELRDKKK